MKKLKDRIVPPADTDYGLRECDPIEYVEAICAGDNIARSDAPVTAIHAMLVRAGHKISLSMVRKIVKAQREHHAEIDRSVASGTPNVLSLCPYKGAESWGFILGYKYPYLTARKLHQRIDRYMPCSISLDEVQKIRQEAMEARRKMGCASK